MNTATYPILEFDPAREALIEPSRLIKPRDMPEHCVICFFQEVIEHIVVRTAGHHRREPAVGGGRTSHL